MNNIMGAMGKAMNNAQGLTPGVQQVPQVPSPAVPSVPSFPATQSISQMNNQMNFPVRPNTVPEFTGPSVNLSSLMNTYESGPSKPMMQQAPKMKQQVDDIDRFSVASSSDYSEIEPSTRTINTSSISKGKGKGKTTGKSIKI
jgi:hypothetical protein